MPKKYFLQLGQDLVLTAILLSLLGYHLFAEAIHEWLGLAFLGLVLCHNGLNLWWFKKLRQGEYTPYRRLQTGLNLLLILLFLTAVISGILLSKHIFAEWRFHSTGDFVRKIHTLSVHWIQIVLAIHLGLHWKMLSGFFSKILSLSPVSFGAKYALPSFWIGLSAYGFWAFFQRELFPYLINRVDFAFFDMEESKAMFYFDFFAILIAFAYSTRFLVWFFLFRKNNATS